MVLPVASQEPWQLRQRSAQLQSRMVGGIPFPVWLMVLQTVFAPVVVALVEAAGPHPRLSVRSQARRVNWNPWPPWLGWASFRIRPRVTRLLLRRSGQRILRLPFSFTNLVHLLAPASTLPRTWSFWRCSTGPGAAPVRCHPPCRLVPHWLQVHLTLLGLMSLFQLQPRPTTQPEIVSFARWVWGWA